MNRSAGQLRDDALSIWRAGVAAVDSERLVAQAVRLEGNRLWIVDEAIELDEIDRILVVGAGKAGAGMAAAIEKALGPDVMATKRVTGWINVPADCMRSLSRIHLHAGRPAGSNEPTEEGVVGSARILELVSQAGPHDLVIGLISGGGSALTPAPIDGIALADKLAVTRLLSASGANIRELNTVRKQLSRFKGGGLARACRGARFRALIISDVPGDPLDSIGSGPTVPDTSTPADALAVLEKYRAREQGVASHVFEVLEGAPRVRADFTCDVRNHVIGNNARAVAAANVEAIRLGYSSTTSVAEDVEGEAEQIGRRLADEAVAMLTASNDGCLISGGEPVVRLTTAADRGLGGRNQQLVLAAVERLWKSPAEGIVLVSGGTDGEDGPTDAAGAWLDAALIERAQKLGLDPKDYLQRNDAYHFFDRLGGLIRTGPTHTNVCDLRVVLVKSLRS